MPLSNRIHAMRRYGVMAYALLIGAAVLFFCSKSSFAYPINDWSDANIYLSAGKGMLEGRVMYRDLYDHKGPVIYGLHALCALISPRSFAGVYLLEVIMAAWFLTTAYRLMALYGGEKAAGLALPVLALTVYSSYSFQLGDSAEELCLPLMLYALYQALCFLKGKQPMTRGRLALQGFLLGCVFWSKFTLCGAQGAVILVVLGYTLRRDGWRAALSSLGWLLLGLLASTVPWLLYFGLNGAIGDWLRVYLYDNLFLYSGEGGSGLLNRCVLMAKSAFDWLWQNPLYAIPTLLGMGWLCLRPAAAAWERALWVSAFLLCGLGVFITGRTYPYYALALAAFAPAPFIWLSTWLAGCLNGRGRLRRGLTIGLCALCVGLCPLLSPNVAASFGQKRENTMQYRFAAIINTTPNATLLNYGFMDAGFYTAAGIAPSVKYYHQTNVPLQEMLDEQERYIAEAVCDYVVTRGMQPEDITDHYDLVATADTPDGYWYDQVYLYKAKRP